MTTADSTTIDLTKGDEADQAAASAAKAAHAAAAFALDAAHGAEKRARDVEAAADAPQPKRQRTDDTAGDGAGPEDRREQLQRHAAHMADKVFVNHELWMDAPDVEDGKYVVTVEENSFDGDDDEVIELLDESFGDVHEDLANDILGDVFTHADECAEYEQLFRRDALRIDLTVEVRNKKASVTKATVPPIGDQQWQVILSIAEDE